MGEAQDVQRQSAETNLLVLYFAASSHATFCIKHTVLKRLHH